MSFDRTRGQVVVDDGRIFDRTAHSNSSNRHLVVHHTLHNDVLVFLSPCLPHLGSRLSSSAPPRTLRQEKLQGLSEGWNLTNLSDSKNVN
jgi:hypothetical protein